MAISLINDIHDIIAERLKNIKNIKVDAYNNNINVYAFDNQFVMQIFLLSDNIIVYRKHPNNADYVSSRLIISYDELSDIDIFIGSLLCKVHYDT